MRKLPTAPLPSLKKSTIKSTLDPIEILQRSFETRVSDHCDLKKQRISALKISPGCKDGDYYAPDQSQKQMALSMEKDPMMKDWKPNLIKAQIKIKVDAYEMKIKNLESDLAKAEAKAEEADRRRYEDEKSALAKIGDAMQGKERADAKSAKLMIEIEQKKKKLVIEIEQIKKKASETEALKKRINQLLKDKEETYHKFSNQVLEESAKSFRAGWFEALKDDAEKTSKS